MLNGEGNEEGKKTTIGLNSQKTTLHVQHTIFVYFSDIVLHDFNMTLPRLHVLWRKCRVFASFFHCRSFSPWWSLVFFIFTPPL